MKLSTTALSVATLSLAMISSVSAQSTGQREADHMVAARASLSHALDADHTAPGSQFRATLRDNVRLSDGTQLRRGDALLGNVTTDDTNTAGKSHLALRFTSAVLKNGQTVPVKATIVALYTPDNLVSDDYDATQQIPNGWTDGTLRVDQIGVVKGVDLHSSIASDNSGVFVSAQNDVKLPAGSEIALAISAQTNPSTNGGL
jgi:hypothetical protein